MTLAAASDEDEIKNHGRTRPTPIFRVFKHFCWARKKFKLDLKLDDLNVFIISNERLGDDTDKARAVFWRPLALEVQNANRKVECISTKAKGLRKAKNNWGALCSLAIPKRRNLEFDLRNYCYICSQKLLVELDAGEEVRFEEF